MQGNGVIDGRLPCPYPPHHPKQLAWLRDRARRGLPTRNPFDADLEDDEGLVPKQLHIEYVSIAGLAKWDGLLWRIYVRKREIDNRIRSRQKKWRNRSQNGTPIQREKAKLRMRAFRAQKKKDKEKELALAEGRPIVMSPIGQPFGRRRPEKLDRYDGFQ